MDRLIVECSPLHHLPQTNTTHTTPDIIVDTEARYVGSTVTVTCPESYHVVGETILTCQPNGKWNVDALPHCTDVFYGVPDSTKIYIGVFAICAALCVMVFAVIIAKIICYRDRRGFGESDLLGQGTESVSSMPYISEKHNQENINGLIEQPTLAIIVEPTMDPEEQHIEMYVNETFHEYDQEKWRNRISSYDSSFDEPDFDSESRKISSQSNGGVHHEFDRYGRPPQPIPEMLDDDQTPF